MDCYAAAIDAHMEEEDIVADQLKEYLFFGNALQGLSSRHQMAQLEVEKAESHLNLQQYNKSRSLGQDGYLTKLWGKWTGTTETPDDRQAKIETIERNIDEAQVLVQTASTQLR
jgi:sorting nexin-4